MRLYCEAGTSQPSGIGAGWSFGKSRLASNCGMNGTLRDLLLGFTPRACGGLAKRTARRLTALSLPHGRVEVWAVMLQCSQPVRLPHRRMEAWLILGKRLRRLCQMYHGACGL